MSIASAVNVGGLIDLSLTDRRSNAPGKPLSYPKSGVFRSASMPSLRIHYGNGPTTVDDESGDREAVLLEAIRLLEDQYRGSRLPAESVGDAGNEDG